MKRAVNIAACVMLVALVSLRVAPLVRGDGGSPSPIAVDRPAVLVVTEQTDAASIVEQSLPFILRDVEHRVLDGDFTQEQLVRETQWVRDAYALPRASLPWIVIGSPRGGFSGPLPDTVDAVRELVGRFPA